MADTSEPTVNRPSAGLPRWKAMSAEVAALSSLNVTAVLAPFFGFRSSMMWDSIVVLPYAVGSTISEGSSLLLTLFVVLLSGDPLSSFGFQRLRWGRDTFAFVLGLSLPFTFHLIYRPFYSIFWPPANPGEAGYGQWSMAEYAHLPHTPLWFLLVQCLMIGCAEETFFRGYLITRLKELCGSVWLAFILQALFFGLVHSYEGFLGMVNALMLGLTYGAIFIWTKSLWPTILAHALFDFYLMNWLIR